MPLPPARPSRLDATSEDGLAQKSRPTHPGPDECQQSALFQQINAVLARFFSFLFGVHGDSWRVELYIRRDDGFGTVDEEERREAG